MALLLPAHMKTILTSFARFHITSARPYVVLHAYWLWRVSKLDLAVVRDGNFTFLLSFSFSFGGLGLKVLDHRLGRRAGCIGLRLWSSCAWRCRRHRHDVVLNLRVQGPFFNCIINWSSKSIPLHLRSCFFSHLLTREPCQLGVVGHD